MCKSERKSTISSGGVDVNPRPKKKQTKKQTNNTQVVVGDRVLMICVRNANRLLMLWSEDSAGLVWPVIPKFG